MNREEKLKNFISKEDYNLAVENAPYSLYRNGTWRFLINP